MQRAQRPTNILLNEVTTVGGVYALNQFMAPPSGAAASAYSSQGGATSGVAVNIGASSGPVGGYGSNAVQTQQIGMMNAFRMVNNITDYTQGTANPVAANTWATPSSAMTYTIANILAACVNTNPAVSATNCSNLMTYTKVGSYSPADTIQAAWSMARYPQTSQSTNLYNLVPATGAAFGGSLASAPGQFTIEVGLAPKVPSGNPLNALGPYAISNPSAGAIDEYGHLWAINMNPQAATATTSAPNNNVFVSEIDSNGAFLNGPYNSYTAHGGYQVSGADPCATTYTHYLQYTGSTGESLAIDQTNTVFVTNADEVPVATGGIAGGNCASTGTGFSIMRITGSNSTGAGAALTTGYYVNDGAVTALAVDGLGNVWAPGGSYSSNNGTPPGVYTANSSIFTTAKFFVSTYDDSAAVDSNNNVWTVGADACGGSSGNTYSGIVYETSFSTLGSGLETGIYNAATSTCPPPTDNDSGTQSVSAAVGEPTGVAIDANNGVWVANYKSPTNGGGTSLTYLLPSSPSWMNGTQASPSPLGPIGSNAAQNTPTTYSYGLSQPYALAVDGSNNVWVANSGNQRPSEFSVTLSGGNISSIQSVLPEAAVWCCRRPMLSPTYRMVRRGWGSILPATYGS